MFDNKRKALAIKILVGPEGEVEDKTERAQDELREEDQAPILEEVDKEPGKEEDLSDEVMGGDEQEMTKKIASGGKPNGLIDAVRMQIMKKKLNK